MSSGSGGQQRGASDSGTAILTVIAPTNQPPTISGPNTFPISGANVGSTYPTFNLASYVNDDSDSNTELSYFFTDSNGNNKVSEVTHIRFYVH